MLHTSSHASRGLSKLVTGLFLLVPFAGSALAASQGTHPLQTVLYQGTAFGVSANVGNTVLVAPTGQASLEKPCGTNNDNEVVTGVGAGVNDSPLVQGGASNASASSSPSLMSQATADVTGISLLGGLISAQELKSVSSTTLNSSGFQMTTTGSVVTGLSVLGIPINGLPAPNTQITLPGIGSVVLNEQIPLVNNEEGQLTVNMIHITVTLSNLLGIPVGTQIIVASASSGLVRAYAPGVVAGTSFGTQLSVSGVLESSPTAPLSLPCYGTAGQVLTNSVAQVNLTGVLTTGAVSNTGKSALTFPYSTGEMTTSVASLNLLSGLVTVNAISGRVDATIAGTGGVFDSAVGSFAGITVAGHPEINDNVPYNTTVDIAGLGTLYLKHIIQDFPNPDSIEIRMIELAVTSANSYNLPIGADIVIGDAQITIIPAAEP